MRQHMFQVREGESMFEAIIQRFLMYPMDYGLDALMTKTDPTLDDKVFFAAYRIFRVESTHSTCWRHAEITDQELMSEPPQDILIAHIDTDVGLQNELLLHYQVSAVQRQGPNASVFGTHDQGVHALLSKLAAQL